MSKVIFKNVRKSFGETDVIKGFDFTIEDGEFIAFLGPSGCGKTTCLRMVAGLEKNTSGEIYIGDRKVSAPEEGLFVAPEKRNIGMVFQSYAVWPHMNVFDNVAYPLKVAKVSKDEITKRVEKVLETVELKGLEKRMPNQLSGGQQQRVALARGLVAEPDVLLLDEPLSNLDAKLREKMRKDIRRIQKEMGITVIYVTHDQVEAMEMSDRMVILNRGVVEQSGKPKEVKQSPRTAFVQDFLS
ncbi:MAG: ABC transporter ATP-binding protein [Bdellovibrionales bacterium]|nr:ABC transporter ATP-binding protein [Bdellovibrionales bacterium]